MVNFARVDAIPSARLSGLYSNWYLNKEEERRRDTFNADGLRSVSRKKKRPPVLTIETAGGRNIFTIEKDDL